MPDIVIPKMGMTMAEATLVEWLQPDGADVHEGEPVLVLATDKLDTEVEAETSGTLRHAVGPGTTLPVGGVLGWVLTDGSEAPAPSPPPAPKTNGLGRPAASPNAGRCGPDDGAEPARLLASPNARRLARDTGVDLAALHGSGPGGRITGRDVLAVAPAAASSTATTAPAALRATPTARRLARTLGIDLAEVPPSPPDQTVGRQDVERAVAARLAAGPTSEPRPTGPAGVVDRIPLTGMRGVIAHRMHESLQTMAQLTITTTVKVRKLVALRTELKADWAADERAVPTVTDLVVRASALALRRHPRLNARIVDDAVELLGDVHVGVAVAVDDGLLVPVVRDTDQRDLSDLAATTRGLAERARAGRLSLDELEGGTFSVTSLGTFGVEAFTPVINPPNVAILGVGRIVDGVEWRKKKKRSVPRRVPQLTLSLTFDHRAVDGVPAAELLRDVAEQLEAPHRLLEPTPTR